MSDTPKQSNSQSSQASANQPTSSETTPAPEKPSTLPEPIKPMLTIESYIKSYDPQNEKPNPDTKND